MKGLHNLSLQEKMCTARVCEVILYILTTLLDLGLLKSKSKEKVEGFFHWLIRWNTYFSIQNCWFLSWYLHTGAKNITLSFSFFSTKSNSQSPLFWDFLLNISANLLLNEKLLSWNVDTNIFHRVTEMDRGVCRGQERIHCPTITWLWIWLWGEY